MTNDKELIAKIAFAVEDEYLSANESLSLSWIGEQAIARYLAEPGKEAVAVVDENDEGKWADILPNVDVRVGDQLFLAPQPAIPEGMALVKCESIQAAADFMKVIGLASTRIGDERIYREQLVEQFEAIAAAGVQP